MGAVAVLGGIWEIVFFRADRGPSRPRKGQPGNVGHPAALPGWLSTTARRECSRVLRAAARPDKAGYVLDAETLADERATAADQELLKAGRHAALREAFAALPLSGQRLLTMLTAHPPVP